MMPSMAVMFIGNSHFAVYTVSAGRCVSWNSYTINPDLLTPTG